MSNIEPLVREVFPELTGSGVRDLIVDLEEWSQHWGQESVRVDNVSIEGEDGEYYLVGSVTATVRFNAASFLMYLRKDYKLDPIDLDNRIASLKFYKLLRHFWLEAANEFPVEFLEPYFKEIRSKADRTLDMPDRYRMIPHKPSIKFGQATFGRKYFTMKGEFAFKISKH